MTRIEPRRVTADIDDDFVVFMIGMRVNTLWKVHKWLPPLFAMPKMLSELAKQDDLGLLGYRLRWGGRHIEVTQYWRSSEQLLTYARKRDAHHLPAWRAFNQNNADNRAVGIWHETYLVGPGQYETLYKNMPAHGLAAASTVVDATARRKTAAGRLGESASQIS